MLNNYLKYDIFMYSTMTLFKCNSLKPTIICGLNTKIVC